MRAQVWTGSVGVGSYKGMGISLGAFKSWRPSCIALSWGGIGPYAGAICYVMDIKTTVPFSNLDATHTTFDRLALIADDTAAIGVLGAYSIASLVLNVLLTDTFSKSTCLIFTDTGRFPLTNLHTLWHTTKTLIILGGNLTRLKGMGGCPDPLPPIPPPQLIDNAIELDIQAIFTIMLLVRLN